MKTTTEDTQPNAKEAPEKPSSKPELRCEACGAFGAYEIGDRVLCQSCYTESGSCCPEFGKDDLWTANKRV